MNRLRRLQWRAQLRYAYFLVSSVALVLVSVEVLAFVFRDDTTTVGYWLEDLNLGHRDAFGGSAQRVGAAPLFDHVDPLLGWAHGPSALAARAREIGTSWIPGFTIRRHVVPGVRPFVIVLMGGSTTDDMIDYTTNWPAPLFKKLAAAGASVVMYNGGTMGYCTQQEVLKLIRDGLRLAPDLVISYSGVNDTGQPGYLATMYHIYLTAFGMAAQLPGLFNNTKSWLVGGLTREHAVTGLTAGAEHYIGERARARVAEAGGREPEESFRPALELPICSQRWLDTWRTMRGAAREFGAAFLAVRQPVLGVGLSAPTPEDEAAIDAKWGPEGQRKVSYEEMLECYDGFDRYEPRPDYVLDLAGLFQGRPSSYVDGIHPSPGANEEIAGLIFDELERRGYVARMKTGARLQE
jgi:lysophospholipase L1-like esterase